MRKTLLAVATLFASIAHAQQGTFITAPMPCFVTTAAPAYTTGFNAGCSMTTVGAIRVDASGTAIQGGTIGAVPPGAGNQVMVGVIDSSGHVANLTLTGANGTAVISATPDVRATGQTINSATLNAAVSIALNNGEGIVDFAVTGLSASGATITVETSVDSGATWQATSAIGPLTGVLASTLTGDQNFDVRTSGRTNVRLRVSSIGAGTITVAYNASSVGGVVALSAPVGVAPIPTNGLLWFNLQPVASDNHANIVNGAHQLYHVSVGNNSATINYLRLYNAGTGFNGCNSATGLVYQMVIPASTVGPIIEDIASGVAFNTGISICVTSGYATTDVTNATAAAMTVNIGYK